MSQGKLSYQPLIFTSFGLRLLRSWLGPPLDCQGNGLEEGQWHQDEGWA